MDQSANHARAVYDAFAPFYDQFNERYQYRRWTAKLLGAAEEAGLKPPNHPSLLDVACGTGLSTLPMVERGWTVTGCDISPEMIAVAKAKEIPRARLRIGDMRTLPRIGQFDLAWAVNDAMNYLWSVKELAAAISGLGRNLKGTGVLLFDVNTTATYAEFFDRRHSVPIGNGSLIWQGGLAPTDSKTHEAELRDSEGRSQIHRQRHFTESDVIEAFQLAEVQLISVKGERDGDLVDELDEAAHTKAVYVGRLVSPISI